MRDNAKITRSVAIGILTLLSMEVEMRKTQEQYLQEILELKSANPSYEIHFCVDSDEILESGWTAHIITSVKVNSWLCVDETIMVDDDEIRDHFEEIIFDAKGELSEIELDRLVDEMWDKEVVNAICVYTNAG